MSNRVSVTDANGYGLKANRARGVLGRGSLYFSLEHGPRRLNGNLPGEVKLDVDVDNFGNVTKKSDSSCPC